MKKYFLISILIWQMSMTLCNTDDHISINDNEEKCDSNSSINEPEYTVLESPTWIGFAVFKTILMIIGLLGNVLTFAALAINPQGFKLVSRIMLQLQAIADSFVCIMGIGLYTQKHLWMTTNHSFNLFLCHVWHSQHAFWVGVLASVMNIVIMTTERFILIVYPMKHLRMSPKKCLYPTFVIIQILSIISLCPTFYMVQYNEQDKTCTLDPFPNFQPYLIYYSAWWFLIGYLLPVAYCIGLYTKIILTLKKRQEEMGGENQILKIADKQLTKTAMAVAGVFIVTMSWDAWFFILSTAFPCTFVYEFHSPLQVMGVFFAALNSCANPFIYAAFLPAFRRSVQKTLKWRGTTKSEASTDNLECTSMNANQNRASILIS